MIAPPCGSKTPIFVQFIAPPHGHLLRLYQGVSVMADEKHHDLQVAKQRIREAAVRLLAGDRTALGREHVGAHRAMADVVATKDMFFAMRDNAEFMSAGSDFKSNTTPTAEH